MKLLPTALSRAHTDPYTGVDFNLGFEVSHYTLDLTYRVEPNLLHGEAVCIDMALTTANASR